MRFLGESNLFSEKDISISRQQLRDTAYKRATFAIQIFFDKKRYRAKHTLINDRGDAVCDKIYDSLYD